MTLNESKHLRVLVFPEGYYYVAVCLEYGITVQAKTTKELLSRFEETIKAFALIARENGQLPFANLEPAPIEYWRLWESAGERHFVERKALTWPDCYWMDGSELPMDYELQMV